MTDQLRIVLLYTTPSGKNYRLASVDWGRNYCTERKQESAFHRSLITSSDALYVYVYNLPSNHALNHR